MCHSCLMGSHFGFPPIAGVAPRIAPRIGFPMAWVVSAVLTAALRKAFWLPERFFYWAGSQASEEGSGECPSRLTFPVK